MKGGCEFSKWFKNYIVLHFRKIMLAAFKRGGQRPLAKSFGPFWCQNHNNKLKLISFQFWQLHVAKSWACGMFLGGSEVDVWDADWTVCPQASCCCCCCCCHVLLCRLEILMLYCCCLCFHISCCRFCTFCWSDNLWRSRCLLESLHSPQFHRNIEICPDVN